MFDISVSSDISQLIIKAQLRGNKVVLMLLKGVDNIQEFTSILKKYSDDCLYIYNQKDIPKPTYDETQYLMSVTNAIGNYSFDNIQKDISSVLKNMSNENQTILSEGLFQVMTECKQNNCNTSMLQNGYLRVLNTLIVHLNKVFEGIAMDNKILFIGKPDKYDILTFTVLGLYGVDVLICDFTDTVTSDCLCYNRFVSVNGLHVSDVDLTFLNYVNKGVKNIDNNIVVANAWVNFKEHSDLESVLKLINWEIEKRYEAKKWKVLNIALKGVDNLSTYSHYLSDFLTSVRALNREYYLVETTFSKPSYDESTIYAKSFKNSDIFSIFDNYPLFKNSGIVAQIDMIYQEITNSKQFETSAKLESYMSILKIWLLRVLNLFFTSSTLNKIPLVVFFGDVFKGEKEREFLQILSLLPIDIVIVSPMYTSFKLPENFYLTTVGASNSELVKFPENSGISKVATMAYNAEKELDTLLYSDTSLFRIKQFKKIRPIVLKTTYEEIAILWNEHAKVRPSFELVGDLVTTPTIFEKVNGVNDTYIEDIRKLQNSNTIVCDTFPCMATSMDNEYKLFIKQLVFKDNIDYKRFVTSKYYKYSVYSEETQSLIFEKIDQLIKMDWCSIKDKNITYSILEVLLNLPQNILQRIHNYDFTAEIPKLIYYNGSNTPCSFEDCVVLMFLKLIGFDIVVFAPTGYRVIEMYISNQWFNEVTIGPFRFDIPNLSDGMAFNNNIASQSDSKKKNKFLNWLLT